MNLEVEQYLSMMDDLRRQVAAVVEGLPAEALNWRPLRTVEEHATNSLAVLAAHIAGAEHFWASEVIGGVPPTREREAEFRVLVGGPEPLVEKLVVVGEETRRVLSSLTEADLSGSRRVRDREVAVRWAILHIIDHTALHLGHMQLTYQLWREGERGPRLAGSTE